MKSPIVLTLAAMAVPAAAQERDLCAARPGLGTPACVLDRGKVQLELGVVDWQREDDSETRTDTLIFGDALVRFGIDGVTEAQVGWTAVGHVRMRDKATGDVSRSTGVGDVTLAVVRNLSNPDGSGFSAAVMPMVTLPVGGRTIGAGTWSAGVLVPVSYDLNDSLNLGFTPEVDAAANGAGDGRHLAYSGVVGLEAKLTRTLTGTVEGMALRDNEPGHATTQTYAAASLAWQRGNDTQLDLGTVLGLNHDSAPVRVYGGVTRRF